MNETQKRYGDSWVIAAVVCLGAAAVLAWKPAITFSQGLAAVLASIIAASALSYVVGRSLRLFDRPTIFLNARSREMTIVVMLAGLVAVPLLAWIRGRPIPIAASQVTPEEQQELIDATTQAPDGTTRLLYPTVKLVADRQEHLRKEVAAGGSSAKAAAQEIEHNDAWLENVRDHYKTRTQPTPATPDAKPDRPTPPPLPPRISVITHDENETELTILQTLLGGPAGKLLQALLGLGIGGGYQTQVRITVDSIRGKVAPSPAQLRNLLESVGGTDDDAKTQRAVLDDVEQIGLALLDNEQASLLKQRLVAVRAEITSPVSRQILNALQENPGTRRDVLLSYLANKEFVSSEQKADVKRALIDNGYQAVWNETFAELPPN